MPPEPLRPAGPRPVDHPFEEALRRPEVVPGPRGDQRGQLPLGLGQHRDVEVVDDVRLPRTDPLQELGARSRGRRRRRGAGPPRPSPDRWDGTRGSGRSRSIPTPPPKSAGGAWAGEQERGLGAVVAWKRRISFLSGQRQRLSPLISRTMSAAGEELLERMERAEGAQQLGLLGVDERHAGEAVAEALPDLVPPVVEVDRRGLAADRGELLQGVPEDGQPGDRQQGLGERRPSAAAAACRAPPPGPGPSDGYPAWPACGVSGPRRPSREARPDAA